MIQIPNFVLEYLINNRYLGKTRTLIVGENYPNPNYSNSYFYRSLPNCPGGQIQGEPPQFFQRLCNALLIPHNDLLGNSLSESQRLKYFLNNGFVLIDAQPNGIAPIRDNPIVLSDNDLYYLVLTILFLNPDNIMFLTNNNKNVINQIANHPSRNEVLPKIIINPINQSKVFAYPAPPANPNIFVQQILALRENGFNI